MALSALDCYDETPEVAQALPHAEVIKNLLSKIQRVDFQLLAFPEVTGIKKEIAELRGVMVNEDGSMNDHAPEEAKKRHAILLKQLAQKKVTNKHLVIIVVEEVLRLATENNWGLCRSEAFIYLYNGAFWNVFDKDSITSFLSRAAEKMSIRHFDAAHYKFAEELFKQFYFIASIPTAPPSASTTFINLKNGTFQIAPKARILRGFDRADFLKHQLPFDYDPTAKARLFQSFLNKVLPNIEKQRVLAEYLGYVFIRPAVLKLEKTLFLYGSGANGKSVFFEIVLALLGKANVSGYSLQSLTDEKGYQRAKLANYLLNYASEINGKLQTDTFKQLASGEPVEARVIYGDPFMLTDYAKLIFNGNTLPKDVEHTNAYFRRFLIIHFDVTIPEAEQDKDLPQKIINNELPGIFNWMIIGLERLLKQRNFSKCAAMEETINDFKKESDTVCLFIDDFHYERGVTEFTALSTLYQQYRSYCFENGYKPVANRTLAERLRGLNYPVTRIGAGTVVYIKVKSTVSVASVDDVDENKAFF
jgi:putative DNA primase/helicase